MRITSDKDIKLGMRYLTKNFPELKHASSIAENVPLRLRKPNFEGLASIIVSQQVSKASAEAILGRLVNLINPLTAENYLKIGAPAWIEAGLSRPKQRTLNIICTAIINQELDLTDLCELSADEAIEKLTVIKGIGPWTAEVYLLFCAGHADIFPAGDLALQEAVKIIYKMPERPNDKQCRKAVENWTPWRGVAARLLWDYYRVIKQGRDASPV